MNAYQIMLLEVSYPQMISGINMAPYCVKADHIHVLEIKALVR